MRQATGMIRRIPEQLRALPLFQRLEPATLERLAERAMEVSTPRATIVFRDTDVCTGLYLLVQGQVSVSLQTDKGQEKTLRLLGEGESFGAAALFLDQRHRLTAQATVDSILLHLPKEAVLHEVDRSPAFARRIMDELARQLHERTLDLQRWLVLSGRQRVADYLLSQVPAQMSCSAVSVHLPAKKAIIASRLNLTQEHFSRILHDLAAEMLIEVRGRTVTIPDVPRLRGASAG